MTENGKRKDAPTSGAVQQRSKKKRTGNAGKWKTPHHEAKAVLHEDNSPQPGDSGIWVTCARHQESKAAREVSVLFTEYAEKMYGIKSVHETEGKEGEGNAGDEAEDDIEAAIQREVAALNAKRTRSSSGRSATAPAGAEGAGSNNHLDDNVLTPVKMKVDCLLFVRTPPVVDPVALVRRICEDARSCADPRQMRCRYVNRLTPVSVMGRATEQGVVEVARQVLAPFFDLSGKRSGAGASGAAAAEEDVHGAKKVGAEEEEAPASGAAQPPECKAFTFAIRPSIRNHSNLKRDIVINTVAGLINDDRHKVNLSSPDKVILVDVYQTVCGMSVVDGDWDELKRFNLTELYGQARTAQSAENPES